MMNDTEKTILKVAREQFVRNGYASTRMQHIADEAGINKAMLHYYFRSKDKLFNEIISSILIDVFPKFSKAIGDSSLDFWDRVEGIIDTYISTLIEQPDIPFFIMYELSQKRAHFIEALKKRSNHFAFVQSFLEQIQDEVAKGSIKSIEPVHFLLNLMGMLVFPFISKPIFGTILNFSNQDFETLMESRKRHVLAFLKSALEAD